MRVKVASIFRRHWKYWAVVVMIAVWAAVEAAGGSVGSCTLTLDWGGKSVDSRSAPEDALAKSLVLAAADLPSGWTATPPSWAETPSGDQSDGDAFDECDAKTSPEGQTGSARSADFSNGAGISYSQGVSVFDTPEHARASFTAFPEGLDCFVQVLNRAEVNTPDAVYSHASWKPVSFPNLGDATEAYRVEVDGKFKRPGMGVTLSIDMVYVLQGRAVFSLQASGVPSPADPHEVEEVARKAHAKIAAAVE